jgi:hypothetical protein
MTGGKKSRDFFSADKEEGDEGAVSFTGRRLG